MIANILKTAATFAAAGLIGVAAFHFFHRTSVSEESFSQGQMPPCDSGVVRQLVVKTIDTSPRAKTSGLKVARLGAVEDYNDSDGAPKSAASLNPKETMRFCKAVVFTNAGKGDFHFTLAWTDDSKRRIWLEATVVTF